MANGPRRRAPPGVPELPEDLKRLQAELLEGLDSGESEDGRQEAGAAAGEARATGEALGAEALREREVLAAAGEERVEDVAQLILRDRGLESLASPPALDFARLVGLEVLSLSNNRLTDIAPLAALVSLVEVNVNFNRISDLSPLYECEQLEKLFASHNQVTSITGLENSCPQLQQLSLYANRLSDNKAVLRILQGLPELRVLDLGDNECCAGPSQRYTLLQRLPRLESLDGSKLSSLDRRLAADFFEGAGRDPSASPGREPSPEAAEAPARRPGTAPAVCSKPPPLPGGGLSGAARGVALLLPGQRLRSSRANLMDEVLTQSRSPSPDDSGGLPILDSQKLDMSDPERTLHKLNVYVEALSRHLEVLQMERDNLKFEIRLLERDGRESCPEGLREQVRLLEEENRNAAAVESEHRLLVSRLEKAERELEAAKAAEAGCADASAAGGEPAGDDDEADELRWENELLRKRLRRLQQYAQQLQEDEMRTCLKTGYRPRTGAWLAAEEAEEAQLGAAADPELARLVAENEERLRDLQGEVRDTKTAMARRQQASNGPADPRGLDGVDVLRIGEGEGVQDLEWHGVRR